MFCFFYYFYTVLSMTRCPFKISGYDSAWMVDSSFYQEHKKWKYSHNWNLNCLSISFFMQITIMPPQSFSSYPVEICSTLCLNKNCKRHLTRVGVGDVSKESLPLETQRIESYQIIRTYFFYHLWCHFFISSCAVKEQIHSWSGDCAEIFFFLIKA